jgi:hypothetical protein
LAAILMAHPRGILLLSRHGRPDDTKEETGMTTPTLEQIEADIDRLSLAEQLCLLERIAQRIRERTLRIPLVEESDLVVMANDPAIQRELHQINAEFAATETDGLDLER